MVTQNSCSDDFTQRVKALLRFVKEQKEEIIAMCLTEYDEESAIRGWKQDGIEMGRQEKAVEDARNFLMKGLPVEMISECIGLSLEQVLELQKELSPAPAN